MTKSQEHLTSHLRAARELELTMTRTLQARIAIAPGGSYRDLLESRLRETRKHAERLEERLAELDFGHGVLQTAQAALDGLVAEIEGVGAQLLAAPKTTVAMLRRGGAEELLLEHACDDCAGTAQQIAMYTAIEQLAKQGGDDGTARLAASILQEEEHALDRLLAEIPKLARAHFNASVRGSTTYEFTSSGAGQALQEAAERGERFVRRRAPVADADSLAITDYAGRTAEDIAAHLDTLSQRQLAKVGVYERRTLNRSTILNRVHTLRAAEPWPGYDDMGVEEITARLEGATADQMETTRKYERWHKSRVGVLRATERQLSRA